MNHHLSHPVLGYEVHHRDSWQVRHNRVKQGIRGEKVLTSPTYFQSLVRLDLDQMQRGLFREITLCVLAPLPSLFLQLRRGHLHLFHGLALQECRERTSEVGLPNFQ